MKTAIFSFCSILNFLMFRRLVKGTVVRFARVPGAAAGVRCDPAALGDDSGIVGCAAYAKARTLPRAAEVA